MGKLKQKIKENVKDEIAAFAILGAIIITFIITIGTFEYIKYTKTSSASINLNSDNEDISIQNRNDINQIANEITEKTAVDEKETKKKNEEEYEKLKKENKISSAADKYYIKVNYGAQVVTVYTKDSQGKYTKPVKAMICSTGRYTPTSGVYRTLGKGNWWPLMGDVYGQYSTHIMGDILFHSVPYLKSGDKSSLEYWAYDQLGQRVSMGCVRLTVADAKWIYYNCPVGTQVEFYSSSNPGPLGKPSTRKISNAPSYVKGWDPTDPDSRNPWPKYLKELEDKEDKEDEKPSKPDEDNKNNTIENDIKNDIVNDVTNDVVNDIQNNIENDIANDIENDIDNTNIIKPEENNTDSNIIVNQTTTTF